MAGKQVKLFLVEGTPGGLTTAEITNWTGHIVTGPAITRSGQRHAHASIEYPWKIPDPATCELIDAAEIAEIEHTAFTSRPKKKRVTARLIVRRIPERNRRSSKGNCSTPTGTARCSPTSPAGAGRGHPPAVTPSSSGSSPT